MFRWCLTRCRSMYKRLSPYARAGFENRAVRFVIVGEDTPWTLSVASRNRKFKNARSHETSHCPRVERRAVCRAIWKTQCIVLDGSWGFGRKLFAERGSLLPILAGAAGSSDSPHTRTSCRRTVSLDRRQTGAPRHNVQLSVENHI